MAIANVRMHCNLRPSDAMPVFFRFNYAAMARRSYCDFSIWPYDLEHCLTCCARLWDNFHKVWPSTTYPRL